MIGHRLTKHEDKISDYTRDVWDNNVIFVSTHLSACIWLATDKMSIEAWRISHVMIVTAKCSAGVVCLATVLFLHLSFSDSNWSLDSNLGHTHYVGLLCDS